MNQKQNYIIIYGIIILGIITRLVPHMANFSIITSLGIFAAVYLPKKQAIAIPLLARFGSDVLLGFFPWPLMVAVYSAHLSGVVIGLWIKNAQNENTEKWFRIISGGFGSAIIFFLVTNFVVFYRGYYPQNFTGMIASYANGLPFLRGTLIGDVGYSVVLFGGMQLVQYLIKLKNRPKTHLITT